jgi:PIN domain nuclease of toxin-antitoxin system
LVSVGRGSPSDRDAHDVAAVAPEPLTRDPCDRLLFAACQCKDLRLATVDRILVSHPLAVKV